MWNAPVPLPPILMDWPNMPLHQKRVRAAAANFDGGGPIWPITKDVPVTVKTLSVHSRTTTRYRMFCHRPAASGLLEAIAVHFSSAMRNARVAPPPILIGLAQYGFSQNDLLEAIVVRFSSAKRNARVAPPPILIGLAQYGFSQNGLLEAIVVRFWECNVKRAHAAAANFDGGGPMWPITKGLPEMGMVHSQARDTKRAGTAELCQMCMHFPHSPHHRCGGGLQNEVGGG
ncbi:hypothetical protein B0H10DRAFT_1942819 [Mycena sp. CBHHK59/15]|nr:hypothetical protein B0H10DRAFT_1942819 [Mycena sp. CBHHK59/15]